MLTESYLHMLHRPFKTRAGAGARGRHDLQLRPPRLQERDVYRIAG
jgi:hypothetical protein